MSTLTPTIERSPGLPIRINERPTGFIAGGGYRGLTDSLDATVQAAAELLRTAYGMDVTIRFNSDRKSGGAWLVTDAVDGFGANAEIGIGASVRFLDETDKQRYLDSLERRFSGETSYLADELRELADQFAPGEVVVYAHIGARALTDKTLATSYRDDPARGYYHSPAATIEDALAFVKTHGCVGEFAAAAIANGIKD
jgi:hypothetical protein